MKLQTREYTFWVFMRPYTQHCCEYASRNGNTIYRSEGPARIYNKGSKDYLDRIGPFRQYTVSTDRWISEP